MPPALPLSTAPCLSPGLSSRFQIQTFPRRASAAVGRFQTSQWVLALCKYTPSHLPPRKTPVWKTQLCPVIITSSATCGENFWQFGNKSGNVSVFRQVFIPNPHKGTVMTMKRYSIIKFSFYKILKKKTFNRFCFYFKMPPHIKQMDDGEDEWASRP